jgi:alkylhydroperoxidase family enzyme
VLDDYRTAPIGEPLRTTLAFLEKLTLTPGEVGPDDVAPMLAAGVSRTAIEEAIYVAAMFNVIDRLADAFDFELPRPEHGPRTAWILTKLGYGASVVPG